MSDDNQKFINKLLRSAIRSKQISSDLNDQLVDRILAQPANISDASKEHVKSHLRCRIQDTAIAAATKAVKRAAIPLGRYVETVRGQAGLDRATMGTRLKKDIEFIERFERGHIDPCQLSASEFADIAELFQIRFAALPAMLTASAVAAAAKDGYRAIARSHGGMRHETSGEDIERALESFARTVPAAERGVTSKITEEIRVFLTKVEVELKRRGRQDLFT